MLIARRRARLHLEAAGSQVLCMGRHLPGKAVHDLCPRQELAELMFIGAQQLADLAESHLAAGGRDIAVHKLHLGRGQRQLLLLGFDLLGLLCSQAQRLGHGLGQLGACWASSSCQRLTTFMRATGS
jgi:hypothetical protein